jgi:hypothetical protein
MIRAILVSVHYLLVSMWFSFWPALIAGLLVHLVLPEWEVITFGVVFGYFVSEFILNRKGNWFS